MKTLTLLFALATAALGVVCMVQFQKLREQQTRLVAFQNHAQQMNEQIQALEEGQKRAAEQRKTLLNQSEELAAQLQAQQLAQTQAVVTVATNAPPAPAETNGNALGAFGKMIGKMMQDPDMKKMIRDQQRGMLDQLYGPLIKQLGLTESEATSLKDLLADNMMKATDKASSLFSGTNRAAMTGALAADQKDFEEQVKAFLGEDRYAQYQSYQLTMGDRAQLNMYKQQNGGGALALTDPQTESLLNIMQEEKKYISSLTGQAIPGSGQNQGNLEAMLSSEQTDKMLQFQDQVNQRVFQRATTLLSPDQLAAFGTFQTNQLQMMRMSMSMARKFLNPENSDAAASSPGP